MSKTVRVRIAVAVNDLGKWNASGWSTGSPMPDKTLSGYALEGLEDPESTCETVHFIEADIPVPSAEGIKATMTP